VQSKHLAFLALAAGLSLIATACGGGSTPSAPSAVAQSITITSSSDMLFIGAAETFTATATISTGATQPVTAGVWGSDAPSVASVDGSGRVTGVGPGMATIYVDFQGRRGTKLIRGIPNYQGAWMGSYAVTGCSQTGDFARVNFCSNFSVNRVFPTNLNLTQDRDRVQGRFFLGTLGGDTSGPVQTSGELLLSGAVQESPSTIETSWSLQSATAGRVTGRLSLLWRSSGLSGDMRVNADIRDLNRTSSIAAIAAARAGAHGSDLQSLVRAIGGR